MRITTQSSSERYVRIATCRESVRYTLGSLLAASYRFVRLHVMTCACSFIDMHLSALSLTASVSSFFSFFLSLSFSVLDSLFIHRELYTSTNTPHIVVTKATARSVRSHSAVGCCLSMVSGPDQVRKRPRTRTDV